MVDSTNPRVMADNIRSLNAGTQANAGAIEANADAIEALGSYSTNEIDTGMTDTDGNHIFRKIFKVNALPNNTTANIAHEISDLGDVYLLTGVVQKGAGTGYPLNYKGSILLSYTAVNISIKTDSDFSSQSAILTFEYTKAAAPTPDVSPDPDSRSLEEEPEEPINEELKKEEK